MVDPGFDKIVGLEPNSSGGKNDTAGGGGVGVLMTASTAEKAILCMANPRSGQFWHVTVMRDAK